MAVLKSLTFTALPQVGANPVVDRRSRVIERLEEQKRLLADPNHKRTVRQTVKKDGEKTTVEKQHRVQPWFRVMANGAYAFFIKASQKPVEFEKGKAAIAVASVDKLPALIETLITAVRAGELDEQLSAAAKASPVRKVAKKAA
jgi:uncharacterized protein DUF6641